MFTGSDWFGSRVNKVDGAVGYVSYDAPGTQFIDWMSGMPGVKKRQVCVVDAYKQGNPLGVRKHRATIAERWREANVQVVIIDSFSASFHGSNQNDAAEVMAHYRDLKRFALGEVGATLCIVIVHSTDTSPNKARGSTVHNDTGDSRVTIEVDEEGRRILRSAKYRTLRNGAKQKTPVIITEPDADTRLSELDLGAMQLANLPIPARIEALFPPLPKTHEEPEAGPKDYREEED